MKITLRVDDEDTRSEHTKVQNNNLNPVWDEWKEFDINQPLAAKGKILLEVPMNSAVVAMNSR